MPSITGENTAKLSSTGVQIGDYTYGMPTILQWTEHDTCVIGRYCSIAKNVTIMAGGEHRTDWITTYPIREMFGLVGANRRGHPATKGPTVIGNDVWIGYGATILSGVNVGDGAVIGARAVVTRDIEPYSIVAGNPARHIRYRFSPEQIEILLQVKWWEWPRETVIEHVELLSSGRVEELQPFINERPRAQGAHTYQTNKTKHRSTAQFVDLPLNEVSVLVASQDARTVLTSRFSIVSRYGYVLPIRLSSLGQLIQDAANLTKRTLKKYLGWWPHIARFLAKLF